MDLSGDDMKRTRRRAAELEELDEVLQRYNAHSDVIATRQFLDSMSVVYLDNYFHEKTARREAPPNSLPMSKEQLEKSGGD